MLGQGAGPVAFTHAQHTWACPKPGCGTLVTPTGIRADPELDTRTRTGHRNTRGPWSCPSHRQYVWLQEAPIHTGPRGRAFQEPNGHTHGEGLALQLELVGAGLPAGGVLVHHATLCEGHVPICVHKDDGVGSEREQGAHVQPFACLVEPQMRSLSPGTLSCLPPPLPIPNAQHTFSPPASCP